MPDPWPWPGDDALTRARWICLWYRAQLERHAPEACAQTDDLVTRLGQGWACGTEVVDAPVLTTAQAAAFLGISSRGVRIAVARGSLVAAGRDPDGYLFQRSKLADYLTTRGKRVAGGA